jgi:hypothetical protein
MLTLVAEVLAYDLALETVERLSSIVEVVEVVRPACRRNSLALLGASLKERSCTRLEKDMAAYKCRLN